ncbi:MAG: hypothetical protein WCC36_05090 [Gammaproteobacteria bacterium]
MSGHFPFLGKGVRYGGARLTISAFFEHHGFGLPTQEKYYKWWYDWAKNFVQNDPDLSYTKAVEFSHYPYGQHAHHSFHLNKKLWAITLADLGDLIRDNILPKLSEEQFHQLEADHDKVVHELEKEAETAAELEIPEVGYFRHT